MTGQTSSRSTLSVQPSAHLAARRTPSRARRRRGRPARRRRRSTTSHGSGWILVGDRLAAKLRRRAASAARGQVRGVGEERRVVGVVARAEVDGAGGRRDGRERQARRPWRIVVWVVGVGRLDDVAVHERHDRDGPIRRRRSTDRRRRACRRARSRRRRPTRPDGRPSARRASRTGSGRRARPRSRGRWRRRRGARRAAARSGWARVASSACPARRSPSSRPARRARTVGVSLERGGHASRIPSDRGIACERNLSIPNAVAGHRTRAADGAAPPPEPAPRAGTAGRRRASMG